MDTGLAMATVAEAMLMTRPQPRPRMSGRNALHMSIGPFRLTAMMRCQTAKSRSSQVADSKIAALLTRMSTRPNSPAIWSRTPSTTAWSLMSSDAATAGSPTSAISALVSARSPTSPTTTVAPCRARPTAIACPMPRAAPVTTAIRPAWGLAVAVAGISLPSGRLLTQDGGLEYLFAPLAETGRRRVFRRPLDGVVQAFVLRPGHVGHPLGHRVGQAEADEPVLVRRERDLLEAHRPAEDLGDDPGHVVEG